MTQSKNNKAPEMPASPATKNVLDLALDLELDLDKLLDQSISSLSQKSGQAIDSMLSPSLQIKDSGGRSILDNTQPMQAVPLPPEPQHSVPDKTIPLAKTPEPIDLSVPPTDPLDQTQPIQAVPTPQLPKVPTESHGLASHAQPALPNPTSLSDMTSPYQQAIPPQDRKELLLPPPPEIPLPPPEPIFGDGTVPSRLPHPPELTIPLQGSDTSDPTKPNAANATMQLGLEDIVQATQSLQHRMKTFVEERSTESTESTESIANPMQGLDPGATIQWNAQDMIHLIQAQQGNPLPLQVPTSEENQSPLEILTPEENQTTGKNPIFAQTMLYGSSIDVAAVQKKVDELSKTHEDTRPVPTLNTKDAEITQTTKTPESSLESIHQTQPGTAHPMSADHLQEPTENSERNEAPEKKWTFPQSSWLSAPDTDAGTPPESDTLPPESDGLVASSSDDPRHPIDATSPSPAQTIAYGQEDIRDALEQAIKKVRQEQENKLILPPVSKLGEASVRDTAVDLDLHDPENQPRPAFKVVVELPATLSSQPASPAQPSTKHADRKSVV